VIEACKQSRQAFLPEIKSAVTSLDVAQRDNTTMLFAHPGGSRLRDVLAETGQSPSYTILIGPEGGFTDDETRAFEAGGATGVSLGQGVLRTETAAIVFLAHINLALGQS